MSGKFLLDTNAIIYAINQRLILPKAEYSLSIITEMELFSYPKLTQDESLSIKKLLDPFEIYNISNDIKNLTIKIRKTYGIKLPDSIICATAIYYKKTIISNDKQLSKIDNLDILTLEELCQKS